MFARPLINMSQQGPLEYYELSTSYFSPGTSGARTSKRQCSGICICICIHIYMYCLIKFEQNRNIKRKTQLLYSIISEWFFKGRWSSEFAKHVLRTNRKRTKPRLFCDRIFEFCYLFFQRYYCCRKAIFLIWMPCLKQTSRGWGTMICIAGN